MPEAFFRASESTQICATRVFFLSLSTATSMTNRVPIFTDLLTYAYAKIHQVRTLVFDNYQRCPVPLTVESKFGNGLKIVLFLSEGHCQNRAAFNLFLLFIL